MCRVESEANEPRLSEIVHDPLHALARPSQQATDVWDRFPASGRLENLKTCPGLTILPREGFQPGLVEADKVNSPLEWREIRAFRHYTVIITVYCLFWTSDRLRKEAHFPLQWRGLFPTPFRRKRLGLPFPNVGQGNEDADLVRLQRLSAPPRGGRLACRLQFAKQTQKSVATVTIIGASAFEARPEVC